jgi:hypothetical protein
MKRVLKIVSKCCLIWPDTRWVRVRIQVVFEENIAGKVTCWNNCFFKWQIFSISPSPRYIHTYIHTYIHSMAP